MRICKRWVWLLFMGLVISLLGADMSSPVSPKSIQALVDSSEEGSVVPVSQGTYTGQVVLKDGMTLVGMGASLTILDGGGAECVVKGGANSVLVGFSIRNGRVGVSVDRCPMGVFDCRITDFVDCGIRIDRGSSMIAHNEIVGHPGSTGIDCVWANPRIYHNLIVSNRLGLRAATSDQIPCVVSNSFVGNNTAIFVGEGSFVMMQDNGFGGNALNVVGQASDDRPLPDTALDRGVSSAPRETLDEYRRSMMSAPGKPAPFQSTGGGGRYPGRGDPTRPPCPSCRTNFR